jgi:hypothetical protein
MELTHILTRATGVNLTGVNTSQIEVQGPKVLGSEVQRFWVQGLRGSRFASNLNR